MRLIRSLALVPALIALSAAPALAGVVTLRESPVDDDGRITLGELFEGAGAAADVVVARRSGPTAVMEAGQLQALARLSGLQWSNPSGLRRVMIRQGAVAADSLGRPAASVAARPGATAEVLTYARSLAAGDVVQPEDVIWSTVQAHMAPAGAPQDAEQVIGLSARRALRAGAPVASRDLASPQVIARNDMVQVEFAVDGVSLTVTGRATRNAALGEATPILNVQSGRTIDAVAVGPGRAVAGPAAVAARAHPTQFAAR